MPGNRERMVQAAPYLAGLLQPCVPRTRHHSVRADPVPGFPDDSLEPARFEKKSRIGPQPLKVQIKGTSFSSAFLFWEQGMLPFLEPQFTYM